MSKIRISHKSLTVFAVITFTFIYMVIPMLLISNFYEAVPIYLIAAIAVFAVEFITAKKLRINPFILSLSSLSAAMICTAFFIPDPEFFDVAEEYFIFCGIRSLLLTVNFITEKKKLLIPVAFILCFLFVGCCFACDPLKSLYLEKITGTPDRTGSWSSINQDVKRKDDWQEIVTDTPFKLGDLKLLTNEDYTEERFRELGTYPSIDGSTVCVPMAVEFARQHLDMSDESANYFVHFYTTHHAYENMINKDTFTEYTNWIPDANNGFIIKETAPDILIATEPSDAEITMAESKGISLIKKPVCYDAFVFITHKDNPIESLTVEQIKDIYSGKITNWKEVGGNDEKIRPFQREKNSGSQTAMENLVMGGTDMIDPETVKVIMGMGELVEAVAEYENETASLGYTYRYYIDTLYKNDNIKTVSVNGIAPDDENIRNSSYPFTTSYYGIIREGEEREKGGLFLNWILSDEGQKCVAQAGYITLS